MDRGAVLLQQLRQNLQGWAPFIQRSTHGQVSFESGDACEFTLVVTMKKSEYRKEFTRQFVFGSTLVLPPLGWRVQKKPCEYAKACVREIFEQRGII